MSGPEILHRRAIDPLAVEAGVRQTRRDQIERTAIVRRDGSAGDELLRELERLDVYIRCRCAGHQSRSSSLIDVLARVAASTRLTMTAHDSEYLPSADGRLPGTTTEPDGTRP